MNRTVSMIPLAFMPGCRSERVSLAARLSRLLFGSPNARRANGIVSTSFDAAGAASRLAERLLGRRRRVPVFAIDRMGTACSESLPRIWLSERVCNTSHDDGRRVFVESYPSAPDRGGKVALELGDRYLGEGSCEGSGLSHGERVECFKAAEILYMHAVKRGNRAAASRLRRMYAEDLCEGGWWQPYIEEKAKHARRRSPEANFAIVVSTRKTVF